MRILSAEERRAGLGATDVAAIAGVSKYRTPIDVWLEKTGRSAIEAPSWRMRMGQLLEPSIAAAYAEQTGRRLRRRGVVFDRDPSTATGRPDFPSFLFVHVDRELVGERGLVEIKATSYASDYADDDVPAGVRVQANWQMALTDRDFVDVAVLASTTSGFLPITIRRDQGLIDELRAEAIRFWLENVVAGEAPSVDGSEAYRAYLATRFPRGSGASTVATPEVALQVVELRRRELELAAIQADVDLLRNRIRAGMGEAEVLLAPGAKITLRSESPRAPWKAIAESIAGELGLDLEAIAEKAKASLERPIVLRIHWKEGS